MSSINVAKARDYATGRVLFGLLYLVIGVLLLAKAVVFALLSVPGIASVASRFGSEIPLTAVLSLVPAVFFLALGFGSIAARRWARSLVLAFSLVWLAVGVLCVLFGLVWLPRIHAAVRPVMAASEGAGSGSSHSVLWFCVSAVLAAVFLPAACALFYGNAGVRRECERRDAEARWTDRVPVPVLVLIVVLGIVAMLALQIAFSATRQRAYFGHALGGEARAAWAALGLAEMAAAWGLARIRRLAWVAAIVVMAARGAATLAITRRLAAAPDSIFLLAPTRRTPQSQALLEALRPLRIFDGVTLFFGVVAVAALLLAIGVGPWFLRRAPAVPAPE